MSEDYLKYFSYKYKIKGEINRVVEHDFTLILVRIS
jgi:hypothetical protein